MRSVRSLLISLLVTANASTVVKRSNSNYVVCVHNGQLESDVSVMSDLGANVETFKFPNGFSGYFLKNPSEDELTKARELALDVSEDQEATLHLVPSWGLDRINQETLPLDGDYDYSPFDGDDVNVYVIDTGIDTDNADFGGRATFVENLTGDGIFDDCNGHGTHVAGTIGSDTYGIAKGARLYAYKVFSCSGGAPYSRIISAIEKATVHALASGKKSVINMSLGGGFYAPVNAAVEASVASGVHHSISAGNSNADACGFSPASAPSAVTVASSTSSDARSGFSNWGSCVDIFAPGSGITSWDDTKSPWTISGTSMAAPHVAGVMALLLAEFTLTPAEMETKLSTLSAKGKVTDVKGSPNELLNLDEDDDYPTPTTTTSTVTQTSTSTSTTSTSTSTTSTTSPTPTETPGTCSGKAHGEQYCLDDDSYVTCSWGNPTVQDVAPGTKCCNWEAANRVLLVSAGSPCPF